MAGADLKIGVRGIGALLHEGRLQVPFNQRSYAWREKHVRNLLQNPRVGLIYDLLVNKDGTVYVEMTLTTPSCPAAVQLPGDVERAVAGVDGVKDVRVKVVWEPTWTQDRMSDEARLELGLL